MKFNSLVYGAVSGSIGGITYAHNQGGMYARARAVPTNPNTAFQQVMRNSLSQLTTSWAGVLSAGQRTGWTTFAQNVPLLDALGQARTIPPLAWFIKANSLRIQSGLTVILTAPTVFELAVLSIPTPSITTGSANVSVAFPAGDAWAAEVGGAMLVWGSRAQSPTKNFYNGPYRFDGRINGAATPPTSPQVVTMPFVAGPTGSKMFFKFVAVRADGRPSAVLRVAAIV